MDSSHKHILEQKSQKLKSVSYMTPLKSSIAGKTNLWSWDSDYLREGW